HHEEPHEPRDENQGRRQGEIQHRVVAGKGTPSEQRRFSHAVRKLKVQKRIAQRPLPEREHGRQDRRCQQRQEARADSKKQVFTVLLPLAFPEPRPLPRRRAAFRADVRGWRHPPRTKTKPAHLSVRTAADPRLIGRRRSERRAKRRPKAAAVDVSGSTTPRWIRSGRVVSIAVFNPWHTGEPPTRQQNGAPTPIRRDLRSEIARMVR